MDTDRRAAYRKYHKGIDHIYHRVVEILDYRLTEDEIEAVSNDIHESFVVKWYEDMKLSCEDYRYRCSLTPFQIGEMEYEYTEVLIDACMERYEHADPEKMVKLIPKPVGILPRCEDNYYAVMRYLRPEYYHVARFLLDMEWTSKGLVLLARKRSAKDKENNTEKDCIWRRYTKFCVENKIEPLRMRISGKKNDVDEEERKKIGATLSFIEVVDRFRDVLFQIIKRRDDALYYCAL